MLIQFPMTDDHIISKLAAWITNGAGEDHSFVDADGDAEGWDRLRSHIDTYLTDFETSSRRLAVIIVVTEGKEANDWRERLQAYSEQAATVCSEKGVHRSQIDFRLVKVDRIQSEALHTSKSPFRNFFRK